MTKKLFTIEKSLNSNGDSLFESPAKEKFSGLVCFETSEILLIDWNSDAPKASYICGNKKSELNLSKTNSGSGYFLNWPEAFSSMPEEQTILFFSNQDFYDPLPIKDILSFRKRVIHIPLCGLFDNGKTSYWTDGWIAHLSNIGEIETLIPPGQPARLSIPINLVARNTVSSISNKKSGKEPDTSIKNSSCDDSETRLHTAPEEAELVEIARQSIVSSIRHKYFQNHPVHLLASKQSRDEALFLTLIVQAYPEKTYSYSIGSEDLKPELVWKKFTRSLGVRRQEHLTQKGVIPFDLREISSLIPNELKESIILAINKPSRIYDLKGWKFPRVK